MASGRSTVRRVLLLVWVAMTTALTACGGTPATPPAQEAPVDVAPLLGAPRMYSATWLIDPSAVNAEGVDEPYLYREVVDDRNGLYLVESPNHVATQTPQEVVFCAAIARVPLDPYCASSPRAEDTPNVLSYPIQLLHEWGPRELYDVASHREIALVAASDTQNWDQRVGRAANGIEVECFAVTGTTTAAATDFEICFTNDELHLVASVDVQGDLIFEIDLLSYERENLEDDLVTGFEGFHQALPQLQEQLLNLYPDIPAPRPTPTPEEG